MTNQHLSTQCSGSNNDCYWCDKEYRGCGYATECLNYAKRIAEKENCYKMMLLTGSKKETTLKFYEAAGYNSSDKTAFIQWLD